MEPERIKVYFQKVLEYGLAHKEFQLRNQPLSKTCFSCLPWIYHLHVFRSYLYFMRRYIGISKVIGLKLSQGRIDDDVADADLLQIISSKISSVKRGYKAELVV